MIFHGDSLEVLDTIEDEKYTSIITDPPYGIAFMGKEWDKSLPTKEIWKKLLRVTKEGGYLLAFGSPKTFHRMMCDIEDSGWEIKETVAWIYGQGFPKSYNISKGIDKRLGTERVTIGYWKPTGSSVPVEGKKGHAAAKTTSSMTKRKKKKGIYLPITKAGSQEAKDFEGYATSLKPAFEPIVIAMKPMKSTYVDNALDKGISGLNIDAARIATKDDLDRTKTVSDKPTSKILRFKQKTPVSFGHESGRYPANVILSHMLECTEKKCAKGCPVKELDDQTIKLNGGASRFFYCAKPCTSDRQGYLNHPTIKPIELMEYLVRLVKQPKGRTYILDPFGGSGTTLAACVRTGVKCDTIEREEEYLKMIKRRYSEEKIRASKHKFDKFTKNKSKLKFQKVRKK